MNTEVKTHGIIFRPVRSKACAARSSNFQITRFANNLCALGVHRAVSPQRSRVACLVLGLREVDAEI
jgi:hypothetical protein